MPDDQPKSMHPPSDVKSPIAANGHPSSVIAEDDLLRSSHVRRLIIETDTSMQEGGSSVVPHILIQYWDNERAIPPDVQDCLNTWHRFDELGFNRLLFDDASARQFIMDKFQRRNLDAFDRCEHPAMRADYFRLCYLKQHGGFYVDADEVYQGGDCESWFRDRRLKLQLLCYDNLTDSMVSTAHFHHNPPDSPSLIFYVNNNPLIAPPAHPVIAMALERSTQILLTQAGRSREIQSITGPGNLTASLVRHAIDSKRAGEACDFTFIRDWDSFSVSQWSLDYRMDSRNWRIWVAGDG